VAVVRRFEVFLVSLDAAPTSDPKNTRPCVVISPDELNAYVGSVIVAPISSSRVQYPTRIAVEFLNGTRSVILDQIRTVDKTRLVKKIGEIDAQGRKDIIHALIELFAE
jgi:mRNA interferase MazF